MRSGVYSRGRSVQIVLPAGAVPTKSGVPEVCKIELSPDYMWAWDEATEDGLGEADYTCTVAELIEALEVYKDRRDIPF